MIHLLAPDDKNKWDSIWFKCYESIQKLNYPIKIWNDKAIDNEIKSDDEEFYNEYLSKLHPIYRWDYVRYIILQRYGGAYLDMDIEVVKDFFPLLSNRKVYIAEGNGGEYVSNCIIISPKGAEELWEVIKWWMKKKVIDNFDKCLSDKKYTMWTVGPIALSQYFTKHEKQWGNLPLEILGWHQFSSLTNELAYTRHYYTSVWL